MLIPPNHVLCPVQLLTVDSGDMKIYLTLRFFVQQGGDEVVEVSKIAEQLNLSEAEVRFGLLRLTILGWLDINQVKIRDFFNDKNLSAYNWVINDNGSLNLQLMNEAESITIEDFGDCKELVKQLDELKISLKKIRDNNLKHI